MSHGTNGTSSQENSGEIHYWKPGPVVTSALLFLALGFILVLYLQYNPMLLNLSSLGRNTAEPIETEAIISPDEMQSKEDLLNKQAAELNDKETALELQQAQLDSTLTEIAQRENAMNAVGMVRKSIMADLKNELAGLDIVLDIDSVSGHIRFGDAVFFKVNESVISATGDSYIKSFVPVYFSVLLSEKYKPYVKEIIIEGHADDGGAFQHNLDLSQNRAAKVAKLIVDTGFLKLPDGFNAESLITISGRSFNAPYIVDGVMDKDKSRRVEFLFRLQGEDELTQIQDVQP